MVPKVPLSAVWYSQACEGCDGLDGKYMLHKLSSEWINHAVGYECTANESTVYIK